MKDLVCKEKFADIYECEKLVYCLICNKESTPDVLICCNNKKHQIISKLAYKFIENLCCLYHERNIYEINSEKIYPEEELENSVMINYSINNRDNIDFYEEYGDSLYTNLNDRY